MSIKTNIAICLTLFLGFRISASVIPEHGKCIVNDANLTTEGDTLHYFEPDPVTLVCRAKTGSVEYRNFMCHNLGAANTGADPFTPGWAITGGYWFVGRKDPAAGGPSGPDASQANAGAVAGWSYNPGYWTGPFPGKDKSDPCPDGYRVPEFEEWEKILRYNVIKTAGTWSSDPVNYMAGIEIGSSLMLPAAGYRLIGNGTVRERGNRGCYLVRSNSFEMVNFFKDSYFYPLPAFFFSNGDFNWRDAAGVSVRCIEE